jgi:hypothetical protein
MTWGVFLQLKGREGHVTRDRNEKQGCHGGRSPWMGVGGGGFESGVSLISR